jgi:ribosomal protein S18 acetylase RimI-like enzyme
MSAVGYHVDRATAREIAAHLAECDADFVPPLSSRLNVDEYAWKLARRATRFEAWDGDRLVGLVAAYCNDLESGQAFISSVSVLRGWGGRGIAARLVERCLAHARALGLRRVALEVDAANAPARRLYERQGFTVTRAEPPSLMMVRELAAESAGTGRSVPDPDQ